MSSDESRKALEALGIQLILAVLVIILLVLSEVGGSIGLDAGYIYTSYVIRWIKDGLYCIIAFLFIPSLIISSRRLIKKSN
ncbi:MAG: hypothetical protein ACTSUE_19590 [Promethearchaeota archaeon]